MSNTLHSLTDPTHITQIAVTAPIPDGLQAGILARVLDEIDHGLLLVDLTGRVLHANHRARRELTAGRTLRSDDGLLSAAQPAALVRIRKALKDAQHDCRSIVEIEHATEPLSLAFIPLGGQAGAPIDTVLVMCSRGAGVETLTIQMFAHAKRLTKAEQGVLAQLCAGQRAEQIACLQGVCVSTVRTHIQKVRQKTGSGSIHEIVQRVSRMPQIVSALRMASARD
jgi:DNA-binding CsgD family transcriptional regulator